jgi:hypothetical protein
VPAGARPHAPDFSSIGALCRLTLQRRVDVHGHVTAITPVLRIKDQVFWFVRLSGETEEQPRQVVSTVICMYGPALAHWQQMVVVNSPYLFTGLTNKRFSVLNDQKVASRARRGRSDPFHSAVV